MYGHSYGGIFHSDPSNILQLEHGRRRTDATTTDHPFGGVNVILVGDFHQFLPVATKASAPLFWPCQVEKDTHEELVGRRIYEQFDVVVRATAAAPNTI